MPPAKLVQNPHRIGEPREKVLEVAIGREVRTFRLQQKITVAGLSEATGLSIGMLSKIENGNTSPSLTTLQTLANSLNVPLTAFFRGFEESRQRIIPHLTEITALTTMLPWITDEAERTMRDMGEDYWPYGIEKNRPTFEAQVRWSHEQKLSKKRWKLEELFHPSTFTWYRDETPNVPDDVAVKKSAGKKKARKTKKK